MPRTHGPETLITIYSEETNPGRYRYMFMCPVRLYGLLDPASIPGEATKRRAARLVAKSCAYHLEREQDEARRVDLINILGIMKKYTHAAELID